jgi:hypothetical protein
MLEQSLLELAIATCFSSAALARKLKVDLCAIASPGLPNHEAFQLDCHILLAKALDDDYPRRFRHNDVTRALQLTWPKGMILGSRGEAIPFLDLLFERLIIENGDMIHYRDGRVQDYVRFSARIDPALLVAWRMAKRIRTAPQLAAHDMVRIVAAQQPFFGPAPISGQAVAENHAHIGGAHYAGMALMAGLLRDGPTSATTGKYEGEIGFSDLKYLAQGLLWEDNLMADETDSVSALDALDMRVQKLINCSLGVQAISDAPSALPWESLAEQNETVCTDNPRWLRQQIARCIVSHDVGQAWLWFMIWLWTHYLQPQCRPRLRMAIFYLLSGLMCVRRDLIMDGQGLSRFVDYYDRKRRDAPEHCAGVSAAKTLFPHPEDVAELKVGSNKLKPTAIGDWLRYLALATGVPAPEGMRPLSALDQTRYRTMMDRWHFCVHFFRNKGMLYAPKKVWNYAHEIEKSYDTQAGWSHPDLLGDLDNGALRLVPSRWLRGLDVAGDENLSKTEIYAPALRWLRDGLINKRVGEPASDGLHLSIHAGEDYGHPLSGMRHVDETVQFCAMRAGDRLGHALALGISAHTWVASHGDMLLPVDEHLDNLVWAWHYASIMSTRLPLASKVLPLFERRIYTMLQFVPWAHGACMDIDASDLAVPIHCQSKFGLQAISPALLFRAWQLRTNCSFQLSQYELHGKIPSRKIALAVPDLKLFIADAALTDSNEVQEVSAVRLYRQRWKWLAKQVGGKPPPELGCHSMARPPRTVHIRNEADCDEEWKDMVGRDSQCGLIYDFVSEQELEFIDALQDWLLDAYDNKGLVIETNPTSNVYIARMTRYTEHPIFRWYPPDESWLLPGARFNRFGMRRGPIRVCVNTDDAGIMPTTLRTEYALLREAALEHGVSRTNADSWLAHLNAFGHEEFNRKHRPVWV